MPGVPRPGVPRPGLPLPDAAEGLRRALEARLIARVDPGGAVRDPCRSRVLETALALRLAERAGTAAFPPGPLRGWLERESPYAEGADRAIAAAVLGGREPAADAARELLRRVPEFTAMRKRALWEMLAVVLDDRYVPQWDERAYDGAGLHSWARVQMTAAKVVVATAAGRPGAVTDEDVRLLADTQGAPHVWEGNVLLHLSVLHALVRLPGTGEPVRAGLRKLAHHRRPDGGLPFVTDTDTWCTATAGLALASTGADPRLLHRLAGHLVRRQLPAGGWSYTDLSVQSDVDDTSVAVQFLHLLDAERYAGPIGRGLRSLLSVRGPDGGFPTYLAGAPSEASMTAAALDALSVRPAEHAAVIADGLRFLTGEQLADGSFPPDWSSSRLHTVFRALLVARRCGARELADRCAESVLTQQNGDGGWGQRAGGPSDVISTAYGLTALCALPGAGADQLHAAVVFLTAHQDLDGALAAVPDSVGPRPFVFSVPALPEIFTLLALGHLAHRVAAGRTAAAVGGAR